MTLDYRKLRGKIIEVFGSYGKFAEALGVTGVTVSYKLGGRSQFKSADIVKWCDLLGIPLSEAGEYFFCQKS